MAQRSVDDFLEAGLALLGEAGVGAMTIQALCERLEVTKGSFYHHFRGGLPTYVERLLEYWERVHSEQLIRTVGSVVPGQARIQALTDVAVALPHATEAAIRSWGRSEPAVATVQRRVDDTRRTAIEATLRQLGMADDKALVIAEIAIATLAGAQHLDTARSLERLRAMFEEINRLIYVEAGMLSLAASAKDA
ncbi:hypothetical protein NS220_08915 [Microbacterium testaceum]|uniref:HTH tetR-type domain-containing protein n=1 Tax=Microbacterium testaceum TaxID=2033 RepID=A0A147EX66_MICTE|nr:TetR/AcrR family transcriptional regulator [Microbacterium testaceum]KTR94517.1 hypothetical protein NS220_08915 [Microbacterium testaceum]